MTTDPAVKIRDGVYTVITGATFEYGEISVEKTYFPQENIEDLVSKPKIKVVGFFLSDDIEREFRLAGNYKITIPVQINIQQKIDPTDTEKIDKIHRLITQVLELLEDDELVTDENFTWERTEPLKDENGLIFSYEQLATSGVFQAIFTAHFSYIKGN